MNAKIKQRHTRRAEQLYVEAQCDPYSALEQLVANADAAARAFRYGGSVAPHMAALICPDTDTGSNKVTPEPKETEK